jgi:hypothetical protein
MPAPAAIAVTDRRLDRAELACVCAIAAAVLGAGEPL